MSRPGVFARSPEDLVKFFLQEYLNSVTPAKDNKSSCSKVNDCPEQIPSEGSSSWVPTMAENYEAWSVIRDASVSALPTQSNTMLQVGPEEAFGAANVSRWFKNITTEQLRDGDITYKNIEIISPVLQGTEEGGFDVVKRLYDFMNEHSFVTNSTCGLHVHVAKQKFEAPKSQSKIEVPALKRLAQLALSAEYQLTCLQPADRGREPNNYLRLNTAALPIEARSPSEAYARIESMESRSDFAELCSADSNHKYLPDKYFAINFYNLVRAARNPTGPQALRPKLLAKTVEFRACEATLMASRAENWVRFVGGVFAQANSAMEPWTFLQDYNETVLPDQLLADLGLHGLQGKMPLHPHPYQTYIQSRDRESAAIPHGA